MEPSKHSVPSTENELEPSLSNQIVSDRTPNPWLKIWAILLLTMGGLFVWRVYTPSVASQANVQQQRQAPPPRPIETTTLSTGTTTTKVSLLGQVEATQQSAIRSQTTGIVEKILVQPGDRVKQGQVIAILDDSDQQLAIAQARAQLAQQQSNLARLEVGTRQEIIAQRQSAVLSAQAREREAQDNLERTLDLVEQGALSERALVEAQSNLDNFKGARLEADAELAEAKAGPIREEIEAQRANVNLAKANLAQAQLTQEKTRIIAAESGVVKTRSVSNGDFLEIADPIVTLVAGDRFDIFLELPEQLSGSVTPGMPIELRSRALPQWNKQTTITAVVPSADTASRRQLVRVQIDNPPSGLLPGMAITGNLTLPLNRSNFVVSRDALTRRENQWFVFSIAEGKAQQIPVEMVADMGQTVAIYHPELTTGQIIALRGGDGLQNGAPVKIVQPQSNQSK